MLKQLLDRMVDFIVANPGSSRSDVRDDLIAGFPDLRNSDALGVIDATAFGLGGLGYFDEPDSAAVSFNQFRNRIEVLGELISKKALNVLRNQIRGEAGIQIAELQIRRGPLVIVRDELSSQRDDVTTSRDTLFPAGRPDASDPAGRNVYDAITEIRRQIVSQRGMLVVQIQSIDDTLASLGA